MELPFSLGNVLNDVSAKKLRGTKQENKSPEILRRENAACDPPTQPHTCAHKAKIDTLSDPGKREAEFLCLTPLTLTPRELKLHKQLRS